MSRDQRAEDNWALLYARDLAGKQNQTLYVVFNLVPVFLGANIRQYDFLIQGLREVEQALREKNIPFYLLKGKPEETIPRFVQKHKAAILVTDFDPLRIKRQWVKAVAARVDASMIEVDAHNVVPCRRVSEKQEFAAYTIRPKIKRLLPQYLESFPRLKKRSFDPSVKFPEQNWPKVIRNFPVDRSVGKVRSFRPGARAAKAVLRKFIRDRLADYDTARNDPNLGGQSELSPYLHFGQLSAQRVALQVLAAKAPAAAKEAFLEELIVRRELSDNFCLHNKDYDNPEGFPDWAKKTHALHVKDKREYVYSLKIFEQASTHDPLWNAAQKEMVLTGKMHGYMRMYWAKKILEWTPSPKEAMRTAIALNDKYELDGRDPNGFTGIAWSIGGVHDRAWGERKVFGKIRYMSYNGCRSKFDTDAYIKKWLK